jgi:hypothetical protein
LFGARHRAKESTSGVLTGSTEPVCAAPIAIQLSGDQAGSLRPIDGQVRNDLISALLGVLHLDRVPGACSSPPTAS